MEEKPKTEDRLTLRLPLGTIKRLKRTASMNKRSINSEATWAIEKYLTQQEKEGK